jgi:hypothetical protein
VRNHQIGLQPRSPLSRDEEFRHVDVIFRVAADLECDETRIRLIEEPGTITLGGADNFADPFIPSGNSEQRFFARPLVDAVIDILPPSPRDAFIRGDANFDERVELSDSVATLHYLFAFGAGAGLECEDAADANDDGRLDVSDAIYGLGFLFLGGPAPPPPFPEEGADPTEDALECAATSR